MLVFSFFFSVPKKISAQSPNNCGLLNESCCNFAGATNPCKPGVGLICSNNKCVSDGTVTNPPTRIEAIENVSNTATQDPDLLCGGGSGISTAIGCIHALGDQNAFLNDILRWAVGVGSGIAFLLIVYSGFMTMTAAGNPERLKAGQELLTSAIAGLILLIFSVFILRFIGIDILRLDKFGF